MRQTQKAYKIIQGDNLASMREMPDNSVDSIVTDPPYGLSFMGKRWDYDVPSVETWRECLRVLKPGGHLLAFGGSRTYHRLVIPIEDAGFEIRDQIMWLYGSGFPKSHNVSKAIDKAAGAEREVVGTRQLQGTARTLKGGNFNNKDARVSAETYEITAPATPEAAQWDGWGTALKPAHEPIVMARKPLAGTVAANVLEHGTGALNIDGCRVRHAANESMGGAIRYKTERSGHSWNIYTLGHEQPRYNSEGRWPANLIHDGSEEVLALFPVTGGDSAGRKPRSNGEPGYGGGWRPQAFNSVRTDSGSAARYFYCAKASKRDRDEGLAGSRNVHPTVKPTQLMRYLCRLVTPPGGVVLDPFCGSGSTGKAATLEGFRFIGLELDPTYAEIARERLAHSVSARAADEAAAAGDAGTEAQLDIEDEIRRADADTQSEAAR